MKFVFALISCAFYGIKLSCNTGSPVVATSKTINFFTHFICILMIFIQ